jgi:hypothetical protein
MKLRIRVVEEAHGGILQVRDIHGEQGELSRMKQVK